MATASSLAAAYQRFGPELVRKATRFLKNRADATDLVHSLFVDLLAAPPAEMTRPYLYRATTNRCLNTLRDHRNRQRLMEHYSQTPAASRRTDDAIISGQLVAQLVLALDAEHQEVLVMRFFDDMSIDEIAEVQGLSGKTIARRLKTIEETARGLSRDTGGGT
jgi:RNA polymerase sigma-70 factor, ECF subfamily